MRIGFDLDQVFVDKPPVIPYAVLERLYKKKNTSLAYRIPGLFEQRIRILSHHWIFRPPIKENIDALSEISMDKALELYMITGRFGFLRNRTSAILKRYRIEGYFKGIYLDVQNEQPHVFKNRMLQKFHIEKYVDDDVDLLLYLSERNPGVHFFWLAKKSDIEKKTLPKNIVVIRDLEEFRKKYLK